jgi:hypothetical protein
VPPAPGDVVIDQFRGELTSWFRWRTYGGWEAWSVLRWWLLFAGLSETFLPLGQPAPARWRRLMLFAPWIAVLEIGYLVGVWAANPMVVPEPNTLFARWPFLPVDVLTNRYWLVRGVVPTLAVGLVFARAVLGWRWPWAAVLAACLVPVALVYSAVWTCLFDASGLLGFLYGR